MQPVSNVSAAQVQALRKEADVWLAHAVAEWFNRAKAVTFINAIARRLLARARSRNFL